MSESIEKPTEDDSLDASFHTSSESRSIGNVNSNGTATVSAEVTQASQGELPIGIDTNPTDGPAYEPALTSGDGQLDGSLSSQRVPVEVPRAEAPATSPAIRLSSNDEFPSEPDGLAKSGLEGTVTTQNDSPSRPEDMEPTNKAPKQAKSLPLGFEKGSVPSDINTGNAIRTPAKLTPEEQEEKPCIEFAKTLRASWPKTVRNPSTRISSADRLSRARITRNLL